MFTLSSMRGSTLPDDKVDTVLESLNDLPRIYAVYVNWFGLDGKKAITGIKKDALNTDRNKLAKSINVINALLEKPENEFLDHEGYALPPSLIGARPELETAQEKLTSALHKYDYALQRIGTRHIPISLPWHLITNDLFDIIFNATEKKPGYGDQLSWCHGIIWQITGSKNVKHKSLEKVLDNYTPNEIR